MQTLYYYTGHQPVKMGDYKYIGFVSENPIRLELSKWIYDEIGERREGVAKRVLDVYSPGNMHGN